MLITMNRKGITILLAVAAGLMPACRGQESPPDSKARVMIPLPSPRSSGSLSLEQALSQRRSVRRFSSKPLTSEETSQLLWAAQGITEPNRGLRTAPSAGATYPLETYLATSNGLFRYRVREHALEPIVTRDIRSALASACLGQSFIAQAPATIVFTAVPERTTRRYGARGRMYIHMEAGHAAQNVHLQAVALGLGSVPIGAFDDEAVSRLLQLPEGEIPLYLISIGHRP